MKLKNLRFVRLPDGSNCAYVLNDTLSYWINITPDKKFKAYCPALSWHPETPFNSRKAALDNCQRHYERTIDGLFEKDE